MLKPYSINLEEVRKQWQHLRRVKGRSLNHAVPEIIIGNDNGALLLHREIVEGPKGAPVAWRSKLGWVVAGEFANHDSSGNINVCCVEMDQVMHQLIKDSFTTDNFGVMIPKEKRLTREDERALSLLRQTTKKVGDRWETGLLWKEDAVSLPNSYSTAMKRLELIEKRRGRDPDFGRMYSAKIDEYKVKGFISLIPPEKVNCESEIKWYVPHFGVVNPNKPGKFRLVFDAAAKSHGASLNDFLLKGPDLIRPLQSVLWNFRRHKIVIMGDIQDMFHRVMIRSPD